MTYPNNDTVVYGYDAGGLVNSVSGMRDGAAITYVSRIVYDKFGQRTDVRYPASIEDPATAIGTQYTYDMKTRRLSNLKSFYYNPLQPSFIERNKKIQDLTYGYDNVGNIVNLDNYMEKNMDGNDWEISSRAFTYDGFYRLKTSSGAIQNIANGTGSPVTLRDFTCDTTFDDIHNISTKNQAVTIHNSATGIDTQYLAKTYNNTYIYESSRPHVIRQIGDRAYSHDANGNQLGYTMPAPYYFSRVIAWDEENRITRVTDKDTSLNAVIMDEQNWYNDAGQRVVKKEGTVETDYLNQFTSIRTDATNLVKVVTNNIFLGTERVVSVMDTFNNTTRGPNMLYYYHTDHLGSTGFMTDAKTNLREHMEYTPWGETWMEQVNEEVWQDETLHLPNYMFTSKELDATGLYYFGARYYDPQTSVWQSTDPALIGRSLSRLYSPVNLNLYSYSRNNPIIYMDPDGFDWLKYTGQQLIWYGGTYGDTSETINTYKATSGREGYQNSNFQNMLDKGPAQEGKYSINLGIAPSQAKLEYDENNKPNKIIPGRGGIESLDDAVGPDKKLWDVSEPDWGDDRILMKTEKLKDESQDPRSGINLHDSHKGQTHGCVETEKRFFNDLRKYQEKVQDDPQNNKMDVQVEYPEKGAKTNGKTKF